MSDLATNDAGDGGSSFLSYLNLSDNYDRKVRFRR